MKFKNLLSRLPLFLSVLLLAVGTGFLGYYFGRRGFELQLRRNPPQATIINRERELTETAIDFALFWQVWDLLNENHINRPLDPQKLLYGALEGLAKSIGDPYTSFLPPTENEQLTQALNGQYEGVGMELGMRESQLIVVAPLEGSPSEAAGVRAKDAIIEIEGESTAGIDLTEAVFKIRGPAGTVSRLTLRRSEGEPFEVQIRRDRITLESVKWEDKATGVVYIRISRFGEETTAEWDRIVKEILYEVPNLQAVILDLRGNPGGYLNASTYLASEFIGDGVVVYREFADGTQQAMGVEKVGQFLKVPAIILLDGGSASASEILAGALRDRRGDLLVGETSFGKGTVQDARDLPDGSGVHITVAKWLTPKRIWVNEVGLEPDNEISDDPETEEVDEVLEEALRLADQR